MQAVSVQAHPQKLKSFLKKSNVKHETKKDERTKALTIKNQAIATWTKSRDEMTTSEEEEDINATIENQGKKKSRRRRKRK